MAILNHEILAEIFNKVLINPGTRSSDNGLEITVDNSLANFMLAGKDLFIMTLNHFAQSRSVCVTDTCVIIRVAETNGRNDVYTVPCVFPLLKPLIHVVRRSFKTLNVDPLTNWSPGCKVLDGLIHGNMKEVRVGTRLSQRVMDHMKRSNSIEIIKIRRQFQLSDFNMISKTCREFKIDGQHLKELCRTQSLCYSFPSVEKLTISGHLNGVDFAAKNANIFAMFLSRCFPKLKLLNVEIRMVSFWPRIKDTVLYIGTPLFNEMSHDVKGMINIHNMYSYHEPLGMAAVEVYGRPFIITNAKNGTIEKRFQIRDGLDFHFLHMFDSQESDSDDDEDW